ncbi:hypothetical protein MPSEU_001032200 [Mayamaea pseudoterrestris]|nr:hypothetical protein MPSEU_001032200 [Mayamaea pseudoterrestris]
MNRTILRDRVLYRSSCSVSHRSAQQQKLAFQKTNKDIHHCYKRKSIMNIYLISLFLTTFASESSAFSISHRPFRQEQCIIGSSYKHSPTRLFNKPSKRKVPEYFVSDDEDEEDALVEKVVDEEVISASSDDEESSLTEFMTQTSPSNTFYSAFMPGSILNIQVGDVSRARKAWKKRRRSGSPLLVPCSILSVDRASSVTRNLVYLLDKFGQSAGSVQGGIQLDAVELAQRYRSHLKSSLRQEAANLGYEDVNELVKALFSSKQIQDAHGVKLVKKEEADGNSRLLLQAATSRMRAQRRAQTAAVLQFQVADDIENDQDDAAAAALQHTGMVRIRNPKQRSKDSTHSKYYSVRPLSAALRIHPSKANDFSLEAAIENGSLHQAAVFDYDPAGDAGSPLLVVALNPGRSTRDRSQKGDSSSSDDVAKADLDEVPSTSSSKHFGYRLDELSVGMELRGTVVRLAKGGALIDCGIRRLRKDKSWAKCWGRLNFRDAVAAQDRSSQKLHTECNHDEEEEEFGDDDWSDDEDEGAEEMLSELNFDAADFDEDGEESEDITHLFQENDDGSLTFANPDTGETEMLMTEDDDDLEDVTHLFEHGNDGSLTFMDPATGEKHVVYAEGDDADITHMFEQNDDGTLSYKGTGTREANDDADTDETLKVRSHITASAKALPRPQFLKVGDEVDVFVKSVSKNSGQFSLTMDASTQDKSPQDLKRESEVTKRLSRLSKQLGGLDQIQNLLGKECDGLVKATSNTGDWLYVEPSLENVPIGVAFVSDSIDGPLARGDGVRIQIEGLDEERGQLAMRILRRLS